MTNDLPTVTMTDKLAIAGFELTVHQLSNGERVIEDNEESRRLFASLGMEFGAEGSVIVDSPSATLIEGGKEDAA